MILVFEDDLDFNKEHRRKTFLNNLTDEGLEIEMENPDPNRRVWIFDVVLYFSVYNKIISLL